MKYLILLSSMILAGQMAHATQIFTCKSASGDGSVVAIRINSYTQIEYVTDWDVDGIYNLESPYKRQMWNTFVGPEELQGSVKIAIQGKMFVGKPGLLKEYFMDQGRIDKVSVFKCSPGGDGSGFSDIF